MITLGDLKDLFAVGTVNQSLNAAGSRMGKIVHWVLADIYSAADFWWNRANDTFTTVDGTAEYFLNNRVQDNMIWGMQNQSSTERKILKKDLSFFYDLDPTPTDTGTPAFWAYVGQAECQAKPTVAGTLSFVSSNAADISIDVPVRGKSGGIERFEILKADGTNTITGTISWDADSLLSISLEQAAAGVLTFTRGAVVVAEIPPGYLRVQRPIVRFFPVPGSADTIQYHYYKKSLPLVSDAEVVDLPDMGFKALRYGCEEIIHFINSQTSESATAFQKYELALKELISKSERDVAGNDIKGIRHTVPFAARLPETIDGSVLL